MNISNTPYVNSTELPDGSLVFLADADARGGVRDLEETKASKESVEAIKTAMSGIDPEDATPGKTASVLGWQEYDSVPEVESTETDMASHPLFRASLLDPIVKRDDLVYDDSSKWQAEPKSVIGRIAGLGAKTERLSAEAEHLGTETERLSAETKRLSAEAKRLSAETEHLGTETEHLSATTERLDTKTEHLSAETERLSAETERLDNSQEDLASMLQTVSERVPVKLSEMRDEDGNPTTRTAVKLGADGSLKINYRSGTEYHGLELTGLSDDFYAYDEYYGGHLPDPYIGKWKGPFNVGGQAGNVFVPENQPDPKTEEEALQGWVVWYAYGPDSAQLMYKTGATTRDFLLNADTIDVQGTGETWQSFYIIGHVYFTRERGTVHERTMADMDALNGKANISHTHTKSEITDFPTEMPPTAHSHANDSWFTTAIEAVKSWAKALLPSWLTPDYVEPATVASVETKVNRSGDTMTGRLIVSARTGDGAGFRAQLNASHWAELKAFNISVKSGGATRIFSFPDTRGTFAIRGDLNTSIAPAFIANHLYKAGERIVNDGTLYKAKADFTSGAAFKSTDWDTDNVVNALGSKRGMTDLSYARTEWKWDDEWIFTDGYQIPESWGDGWHTETYIDHYGQPTGFGIILADGTYIGGGSVDHTEEHFVACSQVDGDPAYGPFPTYASKNETEVTTTDTLALTSDIPNPVKVIDPASATEAGKAADALATKNALDGKITADYVTDFVQQSAILQARIKSVAQSLIRTAFANFDPDEQSFADLVNILKNIGA